MINPYELYDNKQYWTKKEEELIIKYITSTKRSDKVKYLNQVEPKLRWMIRHILFKYYYGAINYNDINLHVNDALSDLVMKLDKFDKLRGTAFTFCSNVVKRFLNHQLIKKIKFNSKQDNYEKYIQEYTDYIDDVDNIENKIFEEAIDYDLNHRREIERMFNKRKKMIINKKVYDDDYKELLCSIMDTILEFFNKFGDNAEKQDLYEYLMNHNFIKIDINRSIGYGFFTNHHIKDNNIYDEDDDIDYIQKDITIRNWNNKKDKYMKEYRRNKLVKKYHFSNLSE